MLNLRPFAYACLIAGLTPGFSAAVKVYTPAVTGNLGGTGSSAAGAVSGTYDAQTNINVGKTVGVDVGGSTLIQVNNPQANVQTGGESVSVSGRPTLSLGQTLDSGLSVGHTAPGTRAPAAPGKTSFVDGGIGGAETGTAPQEGGRPKTGLEKLDKVAQDIVEVSKLEKERKVQSGAVAGELNHMFDFEKTQEPFSGPNGKPGIPSSDGDGAVSLEGLPDPGVVGVEKAVGKLSVLAANADAAQAPFLYKRAVDISREAGDAAKVDDILRNAVKRVKVAVTEAGNKAFIAAAKGRTTDALSYTKSVYGWNNLLSSEKRPLIGNFPEFKEAVKHVLGQALTTPGKVLPAPTVKFEKPSGKAGAQLQAKISMPEGIPNQVEALPARFVDDLALPETVIAWEDLAALELPGARLGQSFELTPQAGPAAFYRAHRDAGRSVLSSFWLAARQYLSAAVEGLWLRVRAAVAAFLRGLGILATGQGLSVDNAAIDGLRAISPARIELPVKPARARDRFGLGYGLHPVTP